MAVVEVALNTPLADALSNVVQPKLSEVGWSTGGADDSALGEYIILMLVNGKTQDQIATELSNDLLNLPPEDTGATDFARWLFEQVDLLNKQVKGVQTSQAQQLQVTDLQQHEASRGIDGGDEAMGDAMDGVQNGPIPTGPKSMRNSSRNGNKRMIGQISRAMDRSGDAALHRVRPQQGTERINMHNRQPPKGPRNDQSRSLRPQPNGRTMGPGNGVGAAPMIQMTPQQQMQLMAMYEEQARMMSQIFSPQQQQMFIPGVVQQGMNSGLGNGGSAGQQPGRSLFERVKGAPQQQHSHLHRGFQQNRGGFQLHTKPDTAVTSDGIDAANIADISSMEVESAQQKPPEETVCRFNLTCTKQDCPYAHQSPAAPPGITIDMNDVCPFGAACMNRKCVARHPSPAQKLAHKSEQDCKFSINCKNPTCPFRHPTMPMCRNGADCRIEGCKFTHVKIPCRFNPCKNPSCPYKHAEDQKGVYPDKVWVADADEEKKHVSERKFIGDDAGEEELIVPDAKIESIKVEDQANRSQTSSLDGEVVT